MRFLIFLAATVFIFFSYSSVSAYYDTNEDNSDLSALPYSVQTKNILKPLFDNRTIVGGQIIALKTDPNKRFSANYLDIGAMGGVKKGDVFAVFNPEGQPVGFLRIVETQNYTSSFDFVELTIDPSENLIVKKVPEEVRRRLPENQWIFPKSYHSHMAMKKKIPSAPILPMQSSASSTVAPPPITVANGNAGFPPLPSQGTASSSLPALPNAAPDNSGLPPMPSQGNVPVATDDSGLPPLSTDAGNSGALPPLPADNTSPNTALPPIDNSSAGMPPLPGDNGAVAPGMSAPAASDTGGLPPLPTDNSVAPGSGMQPATPSLPAAGDSSLPALPDSASTGVPQAVPMPDNSNLPSLPAGNPPDSSLPPLPSSQLPGVNPSADMASLPTDNSVQTVYTTGASPDVVVSTGNTGMDNSLPALPGDTSAPSANTMVALPPDTSTPAGLPGMDNSLPALPGDTSVPPAGTMAALSPDTSSPAGLPGMDNSLPALPGDTSAPANTMAVLSPDTSSPAGLPGMDNSLPALPGTDNSQGSLPDGSIAALPPDVSSAVPPPTMDDSLPSVPGTPDVASLPSVPAAQTPLPPTLPTDTTLSSDSMAQLPQPAGVAPLPDASLPPGMSDSSSVPPSTDLAQLPSTPAVAPMPDASLPPVGEQSSVLPPDLPGQAMPAGSSNPDLTAVGEMPVVSNVAPAGKPVDNLQLNIPAVPSGTRSAYLQDLPTLSIPQKPAV
jgi:hypothetical protein